MSEYIRKAGDYTIIQSIHIGDKEVVVGENIDVPSSRYLVANCSSNELMDMYSDCLVSDCYAEIMQVFGERIADQSAKAREHYLECKAVEPNLLPLTKDDCTSFTHGSNLEGKIVVIKPDVLRREYQMPTHQIKLCTGGFGSHPNSRGTACFCTDLYSGESSRFERYDILGIMPEEKLPDWAKKGLADIRAKQSEKKKTEAR